jgi:hypothetical protein
MTEEQARRYAVERSLEASQQGEPDTPYYVIRRGPQDYQDASEDELGFFRMCRIVAVYADGVDRAYP